LMEEGGNSMSADDTVVRRRVEAMIGGVEKGGTTSLGAYVSQHPRIVSHITKGERHIEFSAFVDGRCEDPEEYGRTFDHLFPRKPAGSEMVLAKSVDILHQPEAAMRLHRHNPLCRMIFCLRNPVDRAYSSYWYQVWRGAEEAATFEKALEREWERRGKGIWDPHRMYVEKGEYVRHLRRICGVFGEELVHIVLLEDLSSEPGETVNGVFQFLGLETLSDAMIGARVKNAARMTRWPRFAQLVYRQGYVKAAVRQLVPKDVRHALIRGFRRFNATPSAPPVMKAETRQLLVEHFRPYNDQLEEFLGRSLGQWNS